MCFYHLQTRAKLHNQSQSTSAGCCCSTAHSVKCIPPNSQSIAEVVHTQAPATSSALLSTAPISYNNLLSPPFHTKHWTTEDKESSKTATGSGTLSLSKSNLYSSKFLPTFRLCIFIPFTIVLLEKLTKVQSFPGLPAKKRCLFGPFTCLNCEAISVWKQYLAQGVATNLQYEISAF